MTTCSDPNTNSSWFTQSTPYNKAIKHDFRHQFYEFLFDNIFLLVKCIIQWLYLISSCKHDIFNCCDLINIKYICRKRKSS